DVAVPALAGLPALDAGRFEAAIHARYDSLPHVFTLGGNTLTLYDGLRDPTLSPPNAPGNPEIRAALEAHSGQRYLKIDFPIHASVPAAAFNAYGTATVWRRVDEGGGTVRVDLEGGGTVRVDLAAEPADAALQTRIEFDTTHPAA